MEPSNSHPMATLWMSLYFKVIAGIPGLADLDMNVMRRNSHAGIVNVDYANLRVPSWFAWLFPRRQT